MLSLGEEGYAVGVENKILSADNVEITIKKEINKVDEETKKEVLQIMVGVIVKKF